MGITHNPPMVLVADDEVHAAAMLRHIFEREGYAVECAYDGLEALEMARKLEPDLILLDIQMPGMNGFDVLEKLRDNTVTSGIPIIIVSARNREPADVARGLNIGADDYLPKPFEPQELLARARAKMRSRQLEEALQQRTQELEALLRVGEELNHHLEIEDLFQLVPYLAMDLLPVDLVTIYQFDEQGHIAMSHTQAKSQAIAASGFDLSAEVIDAALTAPSELVWPSDIIVSGPFPHGMIVALQQADNLLGLLIVASEEIAYDINHRRLYRGISRQVALALHNAELYEIQANYALHLEDMVAARTEELRSTQEMLFRSEKLASIGNLAASIAHEINNPLQPIRLNLDYIVEDLRAGEAVDVELIEMTQHSVERIGRIVQQLLEFTRGNKDGKYALLDINHIIQGIMRLNQKAFEQEGVRISLELGDIGDVVGSRDQIEQVFMNLTINAKHAMQPGGQLLVRTWQEADYIMIQFRDTGTGIPEDILKNIFDPFVSTKEDGTGLGLFVTYGIIENHNGRIEVQTKVGAGTTFTIMLPAEPQTTDA